jgi:hypothetical protein
MMALVKITLASVAGDAASAVRLEPPVEDAISPLKSHWTTAALSDTRTHEKKNKPEYKVFMLRKVLYKGDAVGEFCF